MPGSTSRFFRPAYFFLLSTPSYLTNSSSFHSRFSRFRYWFILVDRGRQLSQWSSSPRSARLVDHSSVQCGHYLLTPLTLIEHSSRNWVISVAPQSLSSSSICGLFPFIVTRPFVFVFPSVSFVHIGVIRVYLQ